MPRATRIWTIADAKARLSEILRLSSTEGPQRIGAQKRYVLVPEDVWDKVNASTPPLGPWLIDNMPRAAKTGEEIELPNRKARSRGTALEPLATRDEDAQ